MNQIVPAESLKTAAPTPEPVAIQPLSRPQDWESLVTPGHVLQARLTHRRFGYLAAAVASGLVSLYVALAGPAFLAVPIPAAVWRFLSDDPNTYTDLGDGNRTSYKLRWLARLPREQGLTVDAWKALNGAVRADAVEHGLDPHAWTATAALASAPKITRPARVFSAENVVDKLAAGIVALPEPDAMQEIALVAWVDGRLLTTWANGAGCYTTGPAFDGCATAPTTDDNFIRVMEGMRPSHLTAPEGVR